VERGLADPTVNNVETGCSLESTTTEDDIDEDELLIFKARPGLREVHLFRLTSYTRANLYLKLLLSNSALAVTTWKLTSCPRCSRRAHGQDHGEVSRRSTPRRR